MTTTVAIGRYAILPILIIGAIFHVKRIYRDNKRLGTSVIIKMLLSIVLLFISALSALVKPPIWWIHWIGSVCFHFSVLFSYFAIDQYINNKFAQNIARGKLFIGLIFLSAIRIYVEFERRNNMFSFMENETPYPTTGFYISTLLHYVPALYLNAIITNLYWKNIKEAKLTPSYMLRRIMCMLGFALATFAFLCLSLTVPLAIIDIDKYRVYLNSVYHISKPIILLFLMAGMVLPNQLFTTLVWPIERYLIWKRNKHYQLLEYLMNCYTTIVPSQQYHSQIKKPANYSMPIKRINASIGDGRLLTLSHKLFNVLEAKEEAKYLFDLLNNRITFDSPGDHPPPISPKNITRHNINVAKKLRALNKRSWGFVESSKFRRQG